MDGFAIRGDSHTIQIPCPVFMRLKRYVIPTALVGACAAVVVSACREDTAFDSEKVASLAAKAKKVEGKTPYGQPPDGYVLSFAEEFDSFDPQLWNDHAWYEQPNPTRNYAVEDGKLKIWPQRDAHGKFFNRTLDTDGKFKQKYGYFEMEARLVRGKGTWPAFWLFAHPGDRRPEIDVMEAYPGGIEPWGFTDDEGVARPTSYAATVWLTEGVSAGEYKHDACTDLSARFHKYAVKWEPDQLTFYFDGKPVHTVHAVMADPMYIMIDLWFGSSSGEPDDSTPQGKGNSFAVNYVRAWRFKTPRLE